MGELKMIQKVIQAVGGLIPVFPPPFFCLHLLAGGNMLFIVFRKLDTKSTIETMLRAEQFLRDNPERNEVVTDLFTIRRGYVVEDVLERSQLKEVK